MIIPTDRVGHVRMLQIVAPSATIAERAFDALGDAGFAERKPFFQQRVFHAIASGPTRRTSSARAISRWLCVAGERFADQSWSIATLVRIYGGTMSIAPSPVAPIRPMPARLPQSRAVACHLLR